MTSPGDDDTPRPRSSPSSPSTARSLESPSGPMSHSPFRVLSLDGGGMRGAYTATYLATVAQGFARQRGVRELDLGSAFDLVVGTSVGGIVACALAAGIPLIELVELFRSSGPRVFQRRLPAAFGLPLIADFFRRPAAIKQGNDALRRALEERFGSETLAMVYARRRVALAITAVELSQHRSWVFKTPHNPTTNHRDDSYRLVDVCLATSAAPVYRSLAAIDHVDDGPAGYRVFADGGLWANNPVLVGLIEALGMASRDQAIHVFCLGTCPRPAGERVARTEVDRGLLEWKFGGLVAPLAIDAQEYAFDNMARMLAKHLDRPCEVVRFPTKSVPASLMPALDLDEVGPEAMDALINQARTDADIANSRCSDPKDRGDALVRELFLGAPAAEVLARQQPSSL